MSMIQIFNDVLDEFTRPHSIFDQNFGLALRPDDLMNTRSLLRIPTPGGYFRPWRYIHGRDSGVSNVASNESEFKVNLDVQQFKPENLNVKVVDNNVVIEGKHEEIEDEHGFISRQFSRRYVLPESVDPDSVVSSLSSDGVLSISAPKKTPPPSQNERIVPIVQTQQRAIKEKEKKVEKAGGDTEKMEQ